ncbi:unnamed protein product, partial [Chrysoparadoxa australica]
DPDPSQLTPDFEYTEQSFLDDICTAADGDTQVLGTGPPGCIGDGAGGYTVSYCDPNDGPGTVWIAQHNTPDCSGQPLSWLPGGSGTCDPLGPNYVIAGCQAIGGG